MATVILLSQNLKILKINIIMVYLIISKKYSSQKKIYFKKKKKKLNNKIKKYIIKTYITYIININIIKII